eukprot:250484-Chlamydomonas_euryale.AAC.3
MEAGAVKTSRRHGCRTAYCMWWLAAQLPGAQLPTAAHSCRQLPCYPLRLPPGLYPPKRLAVWTRRGVNALVMYVVLRAMSLPSSVPWMELLSYTGYSYVYACVIVGTGVLFGRTAYYVSWLYCAMCMAIFLVSTLKRAVFQEARNLGHDMSRVNYMLLALALWQLPYLFWLSNVKLPEVTLLSLPAAAAAGGAARVAARAAMDATGKGGGNAVADSLAGDRL